MCYPLLSVCYFSSLLSNTYYSVAELHWDIIVSLYELHWDIIAENMGGGLIMDPYSKPQNDDKAHLMTMVMVVIV